MTESIVLTVLACFFLVAALGALVMMIVSGVRFYREAKSDNTGKAKRRMLELVIWLECESILVSIAWSLFSGSDPFTFSAFLHSFLKVFAVVQIRVFPFLAIGLVILAFQGKK